MQTVSFGKLGLVMVRISEPQLNATGQLRDLCQAGFIGRHPKTEEGSCEESVSHLKSGLSKGFSGNCSGA